MFYMKKDSILSTLRVFIRGQMLNVKSWEWDARMMSLDSLNVLKRIGYLHIMKIFIIYIVIGDIKWESANLWQFNLK